MGEWDWARRTCCTPSEIPATRAGLNVLYVSSEEFTNEIINAIRTHTTQAFREKYRSADVLLVDDIQFIAGKESTQEEFFHTFNTLHGQDKQIIVSSDRPPRSLVTLEERMRSRFEWGLAADIQAPDLETRLAILRAKAERASRLIPDDILETIARRVQSNIRELEGALNRILAFADLSGQPLTPQLVEAALADLLPQRQTILPEKIIELVAREWKTSIEALLGRDRSHKIAEPRQVAMYLMRKETDASLPQIGEVLGGRDHTTVMYAIGKIENQIETKAELRKESSTSSSSSTVKAPQSKRHAGLAAFARRPSVVEFPRLQHSPVQRGHISPGMGVEHP